MSIRIYYQRLFTRHYRVGVGRTPMTSEAPILCNVQRCKDEALYHIELVPPEALRLCPDHAEFVARAILGLPTPDPELWECVEPGSPGRWIPRRSEDKAK